ncbi:MAG: hypothetical protein WCI51_03795 [Lentisphaerota bacterium]
METITNSPAAIESPGKNVISDVQKYHDWQKAEIEKQISRLLHDNISALEFIVAEHNFLMALKAIEVNA